MMTVAVRCRVKVMLVGLEVGFMLKNQPVHITGSRTTRST